MIYKLYKTCLRHLKIIHRIISQWKRRRLITENRYPLQTFVLPKMTKFSNMKNKENSSNGIILLYVYLQYAHEHSAKFQRSRLKAVERVDYKI